MLSQSLTMLVSFAWSGKPRPLGGIVKKQWYEFHMKPTYRFGPLRINHSVLDGNLFVLNGAGDQIVDFCQPNISWGSLPTLEHAGYRGVLSQPLDGVAAFSSRVRPEGNQTFQAATKASRFGTLSGPD